MNAIYDPQSSPADDEYDRASSIACMTAMRDCAQFIADAAQFKLNSIESYPMLRTAFLDDDSDYLPAALDMMRILMRALTADECESATAMTLRDIANDARFEFPADEFCISMIALDCDLPSINIPDFESASRDQSDPPNAESNAL